MKGREALLALLALLSAWTATSQSPPAFITNDVLTGCNCAYSATFTYQVCFTAGDDTSGTVYQYTSGNFASGNGACVPDRPTAPAGMRTRAAR